MSGPLFSEGTCIVFGTIYSGSHQQNATTAVIDRPVSDFINFRHGSFKTELANDGRPAPASTHPGDCYGLLSSTRSWDALQTAKN